MYIPAHYEERDPAVLQTLIRAHPFGTWITLAEGGLLVNHLPFLVDTSRGEYGTLTGHVSRANPVWHSFSRELASVVVFQGPESYISPSWYPGKHRHGKAVPTWNYVVVHAHGLPAAIEDKEWLRHHVSQLSDAHEAAQARPWKVSDAPADYVDAMLGRIVGIEIPLIRLEGKWKLSQNRAEEDRLGVVAGLRGQGDENAGALAALVEEGLHSKQGI